MDEPGAGIAIPHLKTFFDIGANVGTLIPFWFDAGADKVIAVEPNSNCVKELEAKWGNDPRVSIFHFAVGDEFKPVYLHICDDDYGISTVDLDTFSKTRWVTEKHKQWNRIERVQQVTLDTLIRELVHPYYIKIDVEGYEHKVLLGLSQPVMYLSFEFHAEIRSETLECITSVFQLGMRSYYPLTKEVSEIPKGEWMDFDQIVDWVRKLPPMGWGNIFVRA